MKKSYQDIFVEFEKLILKGMWESKGLRIAKILDKC